jgi:hypothetical protein
MPCPSLISRHGGPPLPRVLLSRKALVKLGVSPSASKAAALPITQGGITFTMAQKLAWLDDSNFVVGRWDGSISIYNFETAANQGPLMQTVFGKPAVEGIQMLAANSAAWPNYFISSNDKQSLTMWSI